MLWLLLLLTPQSVPASETTTTHPLIALQEDPTAALSLAEDLVEQRIESDPEGVRYVLGHLLEQAGREAAASQAFAASIVYTPPLEQHSRLRLARLEARRRHPEVAAGLTASILRGNPHPSLITETTRLLLSAVRNGGDCRLLDLETAGLPDRERRDIVVARAECGWRTDPDQARAQLDAILAEDEEDDAARRAADWLVRFPNADRTPEATLHLGRTLHHHRRFDLSVATLQPLVDQLPPQIRHRADYDLYYLQARSYFWQEVFEPAAAAFSDLAQRTSDPKNRAKAHYQAGRSLELAGNWRRAREQFAAAAGISPTSTWTALGVLSALRIDWRLGSEANALATYETLRSRSSWNHFAAQAAVFLAASDLVQGRTDRAPAWLAQAAARGADRNLLHYWRGRLAELKQQPDVALDQYVRLLRDAPYHPLVLDLERRLQDPAFGAAADRWILSRRASTDLSELSSAWLLARLRPLADSPVSDGLRQAIYQRLTRSSVTAPYLSLAPEPVASWPLWERSGDPLEERLLALGRWDEVELSPILRLFPTREPSLAFAAAQRLASTGAPRKSVYVAEALKRRIPRSLPEPLWPIPYRRTLYPVPYYRELIHATQEQGVDPHLLLGIMREESRFDRFALSAAAARGLTQFVLPTANRIAASTGLRTPVDPDQLYEPAVAIGLGAAYLEELGRTFDGRRSLVITAYNAGEHQTRLWASYCFSDDDAEYFTKVGFKETRSYLVRVLGSQAQYRELYPDLGE